MEKRSRELTNQLPILPFNLTPFVEVLISSYFLLRWPEPSRPLGSPQPRRCPASNLRPRKSPGSRPLSSPASRNPTDSNPEPSPSDRSENSKRAYELIHSSTPAVEPLLPSPYLFRPTCWSESSPSRDWCEKSQPSSNRKSGSRARQFLPSKKLLKLIWFRCLRTLTSALSMPREWLSCPRTFNSPNESVEIGSEMINQTFIDIQYLINNTF